MTEPNYKPGSLAASIWSFAQLFPAESHYRTNARTMSDWAARLEDELAQVRLSGAGLEEELAQTRAEAQTEADARYQAEVATLAIQEDRDRLRQELTDARGWLQWIAQETWHGGLEEAQAKAQEGADAVGVALKLKETDPGGHD